MRQDYEKLFAQLKTNEPPAGLFDKIILGIKQEQELRQTQKIIFSFLSLLIISCITAPCSLLLLANQLQASGISYFISTAISDFTAFLALWPDFSLAILEALPIAGIITFTTSVGIALFTLRLFLLNKKLLLGYLTN